MPKITIQAPYPGSSIGAKLNVDGKELREVGDIDVRCAVDNIVRVHATMLVTESFTFEGDAYLSIEATVPPGYALVETEKDGQRRWHAERIDVG